MAIFRAMRVGGKAIFAAGVVVGEPPSEPPVVVEREWFRPMRTAGGAALFSNKIADRNFSDQLSASVRFSFDGENVLVYQEQLVEVAGFRFMGDATFELNETLQALIALSYDTTVRADVSDKLETLTQFDFAVRGRIRGWNEDPGPKTVDWTPDPKPNLF